MRLTVIKNPTYGVKDMLTDTGRAGGSRIRQTGQALHPKLERRSLIAIKRKSIRLGVWFKELNGIERGILNVVVRCIDTLRSSMILRILASIVVKLLKATNFYFRLERIGRPIAERMSEIFQKWGNEEAVKWKYDRAYAIHLGMDRLNIPLFARLSR